MNRSSVSVILSLGMLLIVSSNAHAQRPVATMSNKVPTAMAYNYYNYNAAQVNAQRTAMSRTQRAGVQSIRYNGTPNNYGLAPLTTAVNSMLMLNGMIPGASAYRNQGYNQNAVNQNYNPYMDQGYYNAYMMNQSYNPYMMNPYAMNPYSN